MHVLTRDKNTTKQRLWAFGVPWSPNGFFVLGLPPRGGLKKEKQVTMKLDPFDAV